MAKQPITADKNLRWYKDAIIYQLHVKTFADSNGDGIGDFRGLISKLDYLESLGVSAIWVMPFYPSPLRDDGYDISDYYSINPSYGTIQDFKVFLKEAHNRGLKVITELVLNHTSDQHPWFQRARRAKPGSVYRDYYVWSDDNQKYKDVRIIFIDYEPSNWTWDPVAGSYYWHRFFHHQPDLNYDNPKVQEEVFKVFDYWADMGVDGFRIDAVPYLFEREGTNGENLPETHAFLKKMRAHMDKNHPDMMFLAEANMWPEDSASYFGNGDECHMNYHFPIMPRMYMSVKMEDRYPIMDIIDQTPTIPDNCQWAIFLRNHDELTLEMVTDEERDYMYRVYATDPTAKSNLGIRRRLAPLMENNRRKIELMNVLLFSLPGTPVFYYGDEIGMGDNFYLKDRDGVRTPMQWSGDRNAGFSKANPQRLLLPLISDPEYSYEAVNVENQQANQNSLLWWTRRIIETRKRYKAFGRGDIKFLHPANSKVLSFIRTYEDEQILVVANLSRFPQAAELDLSSYKGFTPVEAFSQNMFPVIKDAPYLFTLSSHGYYWLVLKKEEAEADGHIGINAPLLELSDWDELSEARKTKFLENKILPAYLQSCRWFGGKARTIQGIQIIENITIPVVSGEAAFFVLEVSYNEGLPEMYALPVSIALGEQEKDIRDNYAKGIIAPVQMGIKKGVLYDAVYNEEFRNTLFRLMVQKKKLRIGDGDLSGYIRKEAEKLFKKGKDSDVKSRILNAEQSNTSIIFNDQYFFKIYRKLDRAHNPDLEITRFLTEQVGFANVPNFLGALEFQQGKHLPMVLGMMQEMVPNQGDAWAYIGDVLKRFFDRKLTEDRGLKVPLPVGSLTNPVEFEKIPEVMQNLLGGAYVERVRLLGQRTAEMHLALAAHPDEKGFEPEAYSLHYQRSLYSSLVSQVRNSFDLLKKKLNALPDSVRAEAEEVMGMRAEILKFMQRIYDHKINTDKIRTHGDYHLGQVLFTGKDFIIIDFEGEPVRTFSERRLKRSPLRDVAGMIRSFHYAAFYQLIQNNTFRAEDVSYLETWAEQWYHYVSSFFMQAYMEKAGGKNFLPDSQADLDLLLQIFILEKAIYELNYELNMRPDWVIIPLRGIKYIMSEYLNKQAK
jgi:maltose alpha-D-glucosyltransferase/alpha-amylase